jgi:hypothetical protein
MLADCVGNCVPAIQNLPANSRIRLNRKQRMSECVIANYVAALNNFLRNIRPLFHEASNQKERCADVVSAQNVQQSQGVRIIRSVVESERKVSVCDRRSAECPAKPPPRRRHGLISSRNSRTGSSGSGYGKAKHGGILNRREREEKCDLSRRLILFLAQPHRLWHNPNVCS